jgi:Zn-dependent protease
VDRTGIVSTALVLAPALGRPVPVPAKAWQSTLDLMQERQTFHESLIDAWRRAPGVHVTEDQASRMAWFAASEAEMGHEEADAEGLRRFADFCRHSGGFTVVAPEAVPAPVEAPPVMPPPTPAWHGRVRRALGPFGVVVILAAKWLLKLKALIFLLPKVKFLGTAFTALVSIGVYALFWGWRFAALFILLMFVHEMGHVIQLRREGIRASAPMFIPFMGAVVAMRAMPKNAYVEAKVGLAGPVLGSLGALVVGLIGIHEHSDLLRAAALAGIFLNLFNLLPVSPLDGGRAAAALHPYVWILGIGALAFLFFRFPNGILLLVLILGGMDAFSRIRQLREGKEETLAYYRVKAWQRVVVAFVYFTLAAALVAGVEWFHVPRPG